MDAGTRTGTDGDGAIALHAVSKGSGGATMAHASVQGDCMVIVFPLMAEARPSPPL